MSDSEFDELIVYISNMKRSFNRKLDDHLFIIQQQNNKIEEQCHVIDELGWQLRDLRDAVRQLSTKPDVQCACHYENHKPSQRMAMAPKPTNQKSERKFITTKSGTKIALPADSDEEEGSSPDYEPIQFTAQPRRNWAPTGQTITQQHNNQKMKPTTNTTTTINNNNTTMTTIMGHSSLPQFKEDKNDKNTQEKQEADQTQSETFKNRRKTWDERKAEVRKEIVQFDDDDDYANVILRQKSMKTISRNSQRGSSKPLCSLMSDIEEEFIPQSIELIEGDITRLHHRDIVSEAATDFRFSSPNKNTRPTSIF